MRNLKNVILEQMIVHILDCSKNEGKEEDAKGGKEVGDKTIYSDLPINLEKNTKIRNYFQERISEISTDGTVGFAVIEKEAEAEVVRRYEQLISHFETNAFVSTSREVGKRLHEIMLDDQRIVPGVLAVCVFKTSRYSGESLLALLKLDITRAIVVSRKSKDEENHWIVTLQDFENALPTAGERLQKAALIRKSKKPEWQMLVLDRQTGKHEGRPAADFFRRFLGAKWKFSPEERTNIIFGKLIEIADELSESDDPIKLAVSDYIYRYMDVAFQGRKINLNVFVNDMEAPKNIKKDIKEKINSFKIPKIINLHRPTAKHLINKLRYRGEDDLMLTAQMDVYKRLVKEEDIKKDGVPYKQITITTRTWKRVKPKKR